MTQAEAQYFSLLRAALWNTPVSMEETIDWNAVIKIASYHSNDVLLCDLASRMKDHNKPVPEMAVQMQGAMRNNLFNHLHLKQMLFSAVKLLREHGIEPVLLKGFGLASFYPNPNLRQFGDIDLFVGLADFHKACDLLRSLPGGYNWGEAVDAGHHYNIEFGQFPMEIHRISADVEGAKETAIYTAIEREGLVERVQRVQIEGLEVSIPSKEFMVFFTFFHAWHHYLTTGVGWRQLSDVAMTLHAYHDQLDLDQLRKWLTSMRLMKPWQTFGFLLVDCLGLPETELPFYDPACCRKAKRLYRYIMKEGNFKRDQSFKYNKPRGRFWQKLHTFIGIFGDFFHVAGVFPVQAFHELRTKMTLGMEKSLH